MLYLLELFDEHLVRLLGVEPELGSVGDGGDDYGLVKEAEVGGGDACDSVAEDARQWRVCVCVCFYYTPFSLVARGVCYLLQRLWSI